ncbi:hypothetical protein BU26DRAFT_517515 [Trematosphaeria pertusa]|uniref:Heterokaryon incompatibility domain-containing protein n=1 Tax=Trematosphaeria pertusa TaxID=390896 RepID=A0A6A6IJF2_9PLEO|nr:uncharacterized protein BU26DRAFT_517515 [Trematosphaeria pertusa]KAF2250704.1 hypothetical protein BU26DRAFT_517515 [Trematosphaeria pertusa]
MADIYRNALITLSAAWAANSRDGLFSSASPEHIDSCLSSITGRAGDDEIRIRTPIWHDKAEHHLMSRAWAFQERILSPRILHFGRHELIWECGKDIACECSALSKWLEPMRFVTWPTLKSSIRFNFIAQKSGPQIGKVWRDAVSDYSTMSLTFPSDILPAISGIAKEISKTTNRRYLAGLWIESLPADLCWGVLVTLDSLARRPPKWRAPTFSWASVISQSGVDYGLLAQSGLTADSWDSDITLLARQHFELIEAGATLAGADPTGQVIDGYLLLRCTLVEAKVQVSPLPYRGWEVTLSATDDRQGIWYFPDYDYNVEGRHHVESGDAVYCFKVLSLPANADMEEAGEAIYLVLRRTKDDETSERMADTDEVAVKTYERIGLLRDWENGDLFSKAQTAGTTILEDVVIKIV